MWLKGLTLEGEIVRNPSVSLSPTLTRNEKVEHYIRIKTHKPIALMKGLTLEGKILGIQVSLSPTLTRNEKVEHYIRIKTHKPIALRFWVESGVNALYG